MDVAGEGGRDVQLARKGVKYRRDVEEDSPRQVASPSNEGGWRAQSVSTGRRKVVESWSSVSPLPNYYLVIFLSECSVNALHRNTAKRSGWIAHHCHQKFRIKNSRGYFTSLNLNIVSTGFVAIGKGKAKGKRKYFRTSHLVDKKAVALFPPPLHYLSTLQRQRGHHRSPNITHAWEPIQPLPHFFATSSGNNFMIQFSRKFAPDRICNRARQRKLPYKSLPHFPRITI